MFDLLQWFAVTMCYYGLTFASADLAGDFYTNYALVILVEIPGYLFCVFTMDCWGRRPILSFCQLVSGVASILAGVMFIFESTEVKVAFNERNVNFNSEIHFIMHIISG